MATGSLVSEPIRIDVHTRDKQRGKFAKIVVEIDLLKPLKGKVELQGKSYLVEYEGLPTVCYNCGCTDHCMASCPLLWVLRLLDRIRGPNPNRSFMVVLVLFLHWYRRRRTLSPELENG
ncbi:hypothetical protein Tsubulata_046021 [Turnera subulata]|uniref:Zinc knuckle CX2CX4HX4C domain-containing protein n=1 Tax=Turnera subulata TaxID=218843 RepID=A0A9Q0FC72_9ROSI|nr:hypothetical protein Tsubulata_046021 [Turnera subulata]